MVRHVATVHGDDREEEKELDIFKKFIHFGIYGNISRRYKSASSVPDLFIIISPTTTLGPGSSYNFLTTPHSVHVKFEFLDHTSCQ
jgi:hypothetical protein